jgi:4-hydroxy-2-oxoglutarate aldolase
LYENKKYAEAQSLQSRLKPVNIAVTETFGVAGLKYACTLMGYEGGFPRSPLLPLKKEQEEEVRQALIHAGFLE